MKIKENWLFFLVVIVLVVIDIFMVLKFWESEVVETQDIIALVGLTLAIFTLVINTFLSIKHTEDSKEMEIKRLTQDFHNNKRQLEQQIELAKLDKNANVLTKYRMEWLQNVKRRTNVFEEEFWKFLLLPTKRFRDNEAQIDASYTTLTNYISFLKGELNITKSIDSDIIKNYELMNVYMSQISGLKLKTNNSYLEKCIKANAHQLLDSGLLDNVKSYLTDLAKYTLSEEEKMIMPAEYIAEYDAHYYNVIEEYKFQLPDVIEVEDKLMNYFQSKIRNLFDDYSIRIRIYFKTEWERIKLEIKSSDLHIGEFDFDIVFNDFYEKNMLN